LAHTATLLNAKLHGLPAATASNWLDVSFTGSPAMAKEVIAARANAEIASFLISIPPSV
jgi:hypothetical protein